ncbi:MAG: metallophosphoesterase [Chloroflexi bacterium]|nr:metallophosphoesterase [Chloroflexota bacterium]
MGNSGMYFVHLSDTHILADEDERLYGNDTTANLRVVIDHIYIEQIRPSFVLITGDLTDHGEWPSYRRLRKLVRETEALLGAPVLLALGNHDRRSSFRQAMLDEAEATDADEYYYSTTIDGLRIIVLDSTISGRDDGEIGPRQLDWLENQLAFGPVGQPTVIALHHPPHHAVNAYLDGFTLGDRERLERVISRHNVLAVLSGHTHLATHARLGNAVSLTAPSTAYLASPAPGREFSRTSGIGFSIVSLRSGRIASHPVILPTPLGSLLPVGPFIEPELPVTVA